VDDPGEREASRAVFQNAIQVVRSAVEPRSWAAFWRTTIDEQPSLEVASELGMSDVAVRKAKSRMIIRLRLELGPILDDISERAGIDLD
jgi:RNA polymerase sigma-70 factor, ECF subfamily